MTLTNTLLRRAIGGIGECARFMAGTSKENPTTRQRTWCKLTNTSLTLMVLCFASMSCFAQLDRGSIAGIVSDPTGAAITGAKVTATNVALGTQSGTITTGAGVYTIPDLPAGNYSVTVSAAGFEELIRSGITVSVGETATVNLQLSLGKATATIQVTGDAPLLQTDSAQINSEVTTRDLNELPININGIGAIRDPMGFASLLPGSILLTSS